MPMGLQRWPLNEWQGVSQSSPSALFLDNNFFDHKCSGDVESLIAFSCLAPKPRRKSEPPTAKELQKKLDALKRLNHLLENELTKWDGRVEKANIRLEKGKSADDVRNKNFTCIVERVQQLSCSPELEDIDEEIDIKDVAKTKFQLVEDKVQKKLRYPNYFIGKIPDYLEELKKAHIPNFLTVDCSGISNETNRRERCHQPQRPCSRTSSAAGSCVGTSSMFGDQHLKVDENGQYVVITNNSMHEVNLGNHWVIQSLNGCRMATFGLPGRVSIRSMATVTIWANGSQQKLFQPPYDFVYSSISRWCSEPNCITILCDNKGQAIAWSTVVEKPLPKTVKLTNPPAFGEEAFAQIDVLKYVTCGSNEMIECDRPPKYIPFPPLRKKIPKYPLARCNNSCHRCVTRLSPVPEILSGGVPGARAGSAPLKKLSVV